MSKVKSNLAKLTNPLVMRTYHGHMRFYNVGIVAQQSIDDVHNPLVSAWVQPDNREGCEGLRVRVAYTYKSHLPVKDRVWHDYTDQTNTDDFRMCVKQLESQARACYAMAVERGLAAAVGEVLE